MSARPEWGLSRADADSADCTEARTNSGELGILFTHVYGQKMARGSVNIPEPCCFVLIPFAIVQGATGIQGIAP